MAIFRADILDIELNSGSIARSFLNHTIGAGDSKANRFGVRLFRGGEPVSAESCTVTGLFMAPDGTRYVISETSYTGSTGTEGNEAYVQLPPACYAVTGQFTLAIKLTGGGVEGTMRIVDGTVDETGEDGAVVPTSTIPATADIIAAYEEAVDVIGGSVRFDAVQSLTNTQKETARGNIKAASTDSLAQTFSESDNYKIGEYVIKENTLFRFRMAHAAGSWDPSQVVAVDAGDGIREAKKMSKAIISILNSGAAGGMIPLYFDTVIGGFGGTIGSDYTLTSTNVRTRWASEVNVSEFDGMSFHLDDYTTYRFYVVGIDADDKIAYSSGWKTADLTIDAANLNGSVKINMMVGKIEETGSVPDESYWLHAYVSYKPSADAHISFRRAIVSGESLNDITAPGVYYYSTSVHPGNEPFGTGAILLVYGASATTGTVQIAVGYGADTDASHQLAHRELTGGTWSVWRIMQQKPLLTGKTFSILGDSISSFQGYIPEGYAYHYPAGSVQTVGDTWWGKLMAETGLTLNVNNSYSGSPLCETGTLPERPRGASAERMANLGTNPDYIIIFMGTNDFNQNAAIGTYAVGDSFPDNINNFRNALAVALNGIQSNYPSAKILVCNVPECYPLRLAEDATTSPFWTNTNTGTIANINKAIDEIAPEFGAEVVDLRKVYSPRSRTNWTHDGGTYGTLNYTFGVHPNSGGMTRIKDAILPHLY